MVGTIQNFIFLCRSEIQDGHPTGQKLNIKPYMKIKHSQMIWIDWIETIGIWIKSSKVWEWECEYKALCLKTSNLLEHKQCMNNQVSNTGSGRPPVSE